MSKSDHITALFIGSIFYYYKGEKQLAMMLLNTAIDIQTNYPFKFVGTA